MTNKQKQLLELIIKEKKHLTAEEIFLLSRNNDMKISLASVYRILAKLVEDKQLKKISNIYKQDFYDAIVDNHQHLLCYKCGKVTDIKIPNLNKTLAKYTNVEIQDFDLCIRYICDDCKNNKLS